MWKKIPKPDNFLELLSLVFENRKKCGCNVSYWRGQANIDWKLDSSIVRKALKELPNIIDPQKIEQCIDFWEGRMLSKAKKSLYDYDGQGRKISDIELLAKLQHFGAATRLLDFSKNVLNALWFCVSDQKYTTDTGILLGIDTDVIAGIGESYFNFNQDYSSFCQTLEKVDAQGNLYIWMIDAPVVTQRISAQHSVFLCSKCEMSPYGYFVLPKEEKYLKVIAISPELKVEALQILSSHFDITPYTVFPDIEGFASANSSQWHFSEFDRW